MLLRGRFKEVDYRRRTIVMQSRRVEKNFRAFGHKDADLFASSIYNLDGSVISGTLRDACY